MKNKFHSLFDWNEGRLEDVRFWCEPELTAAAITSIESLGFPEFDGFASLEARGFYLAGIASSIFRLPVVLVRKHKAFYEKMNCAKIDFTNWKGEKEALTIIKKSIPAAKRVLIVDDIFDTGRSLKASEKLLKSLNIEIVGAYYLLNAGSDEALADFSFPIKAAVKHKLL